MHFHYMTYMAMPKQRTLTSGVLKFTVLLYPFLVIINMYLVCLIYAWD